MKNGTDFQKPSFTELGSLAGFVIEFLATFLSATAVAYWLGHKKELKKKIIKVFSIDDEFTEVREEWQKFYKTNFGWSVDFSFIILPPKPIEGNWRLIFIPKGMTLNLAFNKCEILFKSAKCYDDLDLQIPNNIRNTECHRAIWVRDEVGPDQEFLGRSTEKSDPNMTIGITLLEEIIFEIKYFIETGKHLNFKGITFCSGSRDACGNVPSTFLDNDGRFKVCKYKPESCLSTFGIRRAVS